MIQRLGLLGDTIHELDACPIAVEAKFPHQFTTCELPAG